MHGRKKVTKVNGVANEQTNKRISETFKKMSEHIQKCANSSKRVPIRPKNLKRFKTFENSWNFANLGFKFDFRIHYWSASTSKFCYWHQGRMKRLTYWEWQTFLWKKWWLHLDRTPMPIIRKVQYVENYIAVQGLQRMFRHRFRHKKDWPPLSPHTSKQTQCSYTPPDEASAWSALPGEATTRHRPEQRSHAWHTIVNFANAER